MIYYDGGKYQMNLVFQMRGSVMLRSTVFAVPAAALGCLLKTLDLMEIIEMTSDSVLSNASAYSGLTFVLGFLLVFRTGQAYNRYWGGLTATMEMRQHWIDAVSYLFAFTNLSTKPKEEVQVFRHLVVRLFSLLSALALQEIADMEEEGFEVVDPAGVDLATCDYLELLNTAGRIDAVLHWIRQLVTNNLSSGMLPVGPPIQGRIFNDLQSGLSEFHNAMRISTTPFPFPYAQMTSVLLAIFTTITPVVACMWTSHQVWAGLFSFMPVFALCTINLIAVEIEHPFGDDVNDLPVRELQMGMNEAMVLMLAAPMSVVPTLSGEAQRNTGELMVRFCHSQIPAGKPRPSTSSSSEDFEWALSSTPMAPKRNTHHAASCLQYSAERGEKGGPRGFFAVRNRDSRRSVRGPLEKSEMMVRMASDSTTGLDGCARSCGLATQLKPQVSPGAAPDVNGVAEEAAPSTSCSNFVAVARARSCRTCSPRLAASGEASPDPRAAPQVSAACEKHCTENIAQHVSAPVAATVEADPLLQEKEATAVAPVLVQPPSSRFCSDYGGMMVPPLRMKDMDSTATSLATTTACRYPL